MKGVVITGASRGFGRAIAISYAKRSTSPLHIVLNGRTKADLEETKFLIENERRSIQTIITIVDADLCKIHSLNDVASRLFDGFGSNSSLFDEVVLIHNAGSLGPLIEIGSTESRYEQLSTAADFNISSFMILSSEFIRRIRSHTYLPSCKKACIVNISSLAAIEPFESWGIYCACKAAREMFIKTAAKEVQSRELVSEENVKMRLLNYAPGPLDTNMQQEIRECQGVNTQIQATFIKMKNEGQLIPPEVSADRLTTILIEDKYQNGDHIDFYDTY